MSVAHIVIRLRESLDKQQLFTHQEWRSERNRIITGSHDRDASLAYFTLVVLEDPEYTAIALTLCAGLAHVIRWLAYAVYLVTRWVAIFYLQEPALVDALFESGLILNIRRLMSFDDSLLASLAAGICIAIVFITYFRLADRSVRSSIDGDERNPAETMIQLLLLILTPLFIGDWWIDSNSFHNPLMTALSIVIILFSIFCNIHNGYALIDALHRNPYKYFCQLNRISDSRVKSEKRIYGYATTIVFVVFIAGIIVRKQNPIFNPIVGFLHNEIVDTIVCLMLTHSTCTTLLLTYRVFYKSKLTACRMTAKDWLANDIRVALAVVIILVLLLFPFTPSILIDLSILSGI